MTSSRQLQNSVAPDFQLQDEQGHDWRMSDHKGNVVALLFYPKDETFVCTRQLCSVRDHWDEYLKTKAVIVGVSPGSVQQHQQFAQHHRLPLTLLADSDGAVTKLYTQIRWLPVWLTRAIVIVDAKGIIRDRRVMLRSNRPTDYSVISSIYAAQTDLHLERVFLKTPTTLDCEELIALNKASARFHRGLAAPPKTKTEFDNYGF